MLAFNCVKRVRKIHGDDVVASLPTEPGFVDDAFRTTSCHGHLRWFQACCERLGASFHGQDSSKSGKDIAYCERSDSTILFGVGD
jgi:hypothetical protein